MESVIKSLTVHSSKTALDEFFEQKVDFDITLPDYCPASTRILKCDVTPAIISKTIDGDKLLLDMQCKSTVIYVDEDGCIHSVSKTDTFSKSFVLRLALCIARIRTVARAVSVNCRMQNSRRINIKAVIGTAVKIMGGSECQIIGEANGGGIESVFERVEANVLCGTGDAAVHVNGQLSLGASVSEIIKSDVTVAVTDKKVMSDKVLVKGEATVSALYMTGEGTDNFCFFEGTVPFSEVVDLFGADENSTVEITTDVQDINCELVDDGTLGCEIDLWINAAAYSQSKINLLKDVYSMHDNLNITSSDIVLESFCDSIAFTQIVSGTIACDFTEARIKGICAETFVKNVGLRDGQFAVEGDMAVTVYMCNEDDYGIIEKSVPFCVTYPATNVCDNMRCEAQVQIKNLSYSMPSDDEIVISAEAETTINCFARQSYSAIDCVEIGESCSHKSKGVILYNAQGGESLWDIAKKYRSSVDIIKRDNNLDCERLIQNKMLLISFN